MKKITALIELIRIELPTAAGICVVVGQTIALGSFAPLIKILQGFALGFFLSASAMIFNDYFDIEVDRVNSPTRPLPSGRVSKTEALVMGVITAVIALALAWTISPFIFICGSLLWILGFLYNWKWKANGLAGNLIVSLNVAMTVLFGAYSVGQIGNPAVWLFSGIAFLFDLAEEIAGDAMDIEGDLKRGSRSLAIRYGREKALRVSMVILGVMVFLTLLPVLMGKGTPGYLMTIAILDLSAIFFGRRILASKTPTQGRKSMRSMYLAATASLVIYLIWLLFF